MVSMQRSRQHCQAPAPCDYPLSGRPTPQRNPGEKAFKDSTPVHLPLYPALGKQDHQLRGLQSFEWPLAKDRLECGSVVTLQFAGVPKSGLPFLHKKAYIQIQTTNEPPIRGHLRRGLSEAPDLQNCLSRHCQKPEQEPSRVKPKRPNVAPCT